MGFLKFLPGHCYQDHSQLQGHSCVFRYAILRVCVIFLSDLQVEPLREQGSPSVYFPQQRRRQLLSSEPSWSLRNFSILATLSASVSQLGWQRMCISVGWSHSVWHLSYGQDSVCDSVPDPVEKCSCIGYPAFPENVRACLSQFSLLSYNQFFVGQNCARSCLSFLGTLT